MVKISDKRRGITEGPIFFKLLFFALPIMASGLLQVAYNMADNIVVGKFSENANAIAAVSATSSLTSLVVQLLMGLATGSGIVIAQAYGAKDEKNVSRSVHTAMSFAAILGLSFGALALILSRPLLTATGTSSEIIDDSVLYFRIICLGIPASTLFNFGSSVLRSIGNSKTPLYILSASGLLNVLLNLFFVIICKMDVEGVASATVISQYVSAGVVLFILFRKRGECYGLSPKKLCINGRILKRILAIGLPAGLQSSLFAISNVFMTMGVNSLPIYAQNAKGIAFNIDAMVYTAMDSYLHSVMTFVGQNYGARKIDRVKKSIIYSSIQVALVGMITGFVIIALGKPIISLYINSDIANPEIVISEAHTIMKFILSTYFLCGFMNTLNGALRGLGNSFVTMIISIGGSVVLRLAWIFAVFFPTKELHSLVGLYACYPISWVATNTALIIALIITYKKKKKEITDKLLNESSDKILNS